MGTEDMGSVIDKETQIITEIITDLKNGYHPYAVFYAMERCYGASVYALIEARKRDGKDPDEVLEELLERVRFYVKLVLDEE